MIKTFKKTGKFRPNAVTQAVLTVLAVAAVSQTAQAGPGYGDAYDLNNNPFIIQSYFAQSPTGFKLWTKVAPDGSTVLDAVTGQPVLDSALGAPDGYDPKNRLAFKAALIAKYGPAGMPQGAHGPSGKALRKFVDPLPVLSEANAAGTRSNVKKMADGVTDKYIPVAKPSKWRNPQGVVSGDDYYEIASVEYQDRFHSDLGKTTTLRGYVQIDHEASNGRTALPGSKAVALKYPNGSQIYMAGTDANGKPTGLQVAALAYDNPHFLGPVIQATQNIPTRVKFLNLLPVGRAELGTPNADGSANIIARNGDLFLPVDPSITGAGFGPDGKTTYTQNRGNIHLHGGDSPWISDGGPHTWITPQGEADPANPKGLASPTAAIDPTVLASYLRGPGALNVPDMYDPGAGAMTYYFPNGQSARMEWYHDHTVGITRLNAYAGLVSAYFLTDVTEQALIADGKLPGADATIPLILGDRTFVPDDIAWQDARWNTSAWGKPGDSWMPHVYETVQDPNQATNFNSVGRWHWGPWFWPSYPSAYNLPSGAYGDVTATPEAWQDTPTVNGVAYPTMTVEPKPYRLRVLNAANDRAISFNLFVADDTVVTDDGRSNTEMKMVPVASWANTCADGGITRWDPVTNCVPQTWSTDVYGHNGGVPDPTTQGPTLYQIGNEGGRLPGVAAKDPQPTNFLLDKGRAAVLNMDWSNSGIVLGNAERADIVVDFSQYAGKTLLVYSDTGAPVPAADPRNEYFTGYGDNSATGGAEDTRPGYGPNSRTIMQIKVAAAVTTAGGMATLDPVALDTNLKAAYKATQETPVVAQSAYNGALGTNWNDTLSFATVFTGSVKQPSLQFVPGTPNVFFNSFLLQTDAAGNYLDGSGYTRVPSATVVGGGGTGATVTPSMKIAKIHVINGGSGYKLAPIVSVTSTGKGSGANATATLKLNAVAVVSGGSGFGAAKGNVTAVTLTSGGSYKPGVSAIAINTTNRYPLATQTPKITIAAPAAGGVQATATATMTGTGTARKISAITITNPGSGYTTTPVITIDAASASGTTARVNATASSVTLATVAPTVTFAAPAGGTAATGTVVLDSVTGAVTGITLTNGGAGYASAPVPTFVGGTAVTAATATTTVASMPTVTFSAPRTAGGITATGTVVVGTTGAVTGITVTNPGSGYTSAPNAKVSGPGTGVILSASGSVDAITLTQPDPGNVLSVGGGGYVDLSTAASEPNNPTPGLLITISAPTNAGGVTATAGATGSIFDLTVNNSGVGYTSAPTVSFTPSPLEPVYAAVANTNRNYTPLNIAKVAPTFKADTAVVGGELTGSILVKTKAIQELFDPTYGRLNATFGVEIPYTSALTQTTIPLGYVDGPTEEIADGETQIWKITHNGVDTHPIHFHLVNVQLINRVGWDNFITPPEPNELGWKETIKMSPLEDVIVAVRAKKPKLPGFGLQNSVRLLDPSQPIGATAGFTQIDPNTGLPAPKGNDYYDFGWEYVWHCHILGHEENDFMRPIAFRANEAVPTAPVVTLAGLVGGQVNMTWADTSATEYKFRVERSDDLVNWTPVGDALANATAYTDTSPLVHLGVTSYRVVAVGGSGESASNTIVIDTAPAAPTNLTAAARSYLSSTVVLSWTDGSTNELRFNVLRSADGGATFSALGTVTTTAAQSLAAGGTLMFSDTTAGVGAYLYQVTATNAIGTSAAAGPVTVAAIPAPTAASISSAVAASSTSVTVTYVDNSTTETSLELQQAVVTNGVVGAYATVSTVTRAAGDALIASTGTVSTYTATGLTSGLTYAYRVLVKNALFPAGVASSVVQATPAIIAPTGLAAAARVATAANLNVVLTWVDASTDETGFTVERSADGVTWVTACTATRTAAQTTAVGGTAVTCTDTTALAGAAQYRVKATNAAGASAPSAAISVPAFPVPAAPTTLAAAARSTSASVVLTWVDASTNETGFLVQRSADAGVTWTTLTTTAANAVTYTDTTALGTAAYVYKVIAVGLGGNSVAATVNVAAIAAPAAPTTLAAAARSTSASVVLTWVDASTNETGFLVERSANVGVTWTTLATTAANAVTYTDATATVGAFVYRVTAVSTLAGNSTPVTLNVAAIPVPTAPTIALNRNAANNQVQITDTSTVETGFVIQRAPVTGTVTVPAARSTGSTLTGGTVGAWVTVTALTVTETANQTTTLRAAFNVNDTTAAALVAGTTWAYRVVATGLATGNGTTDTSTVFYVTR